MLVEFWEHFQHPMQTVLLNKQKHSKILLRHLPGKLFVLYVTQQALYSIWQALNGFGCRESSEAPQQFCSDLPT